MNTPDFSVIIPQRNSISTLPKLIASIPSSEKIEIILVDNSPVPIKKDDVGVDRDYTLLWSPPERYAGGARNVGIENAKGRWLIFADADDYFTENAFIIFSNYIDSDAELICFSCDGIYTDTGDHSERGDRYTNLVRGYLDGMRDETQLRLCWPVPWAKMVSKKLVDRMNIRYDEVIASNDEYFSLLTGFYAKKIMAVDEKVYVVTVSRGSLTRRMDKDAILTRFKVKLRYNKFVKEQGLPEYQKSIMNFFSMSLKFGVRPFWTCCSLLVKYKQNPFIGYKNWIHTIAKVNRKYKEEGKYFTK